MKKKIQELEGGTRIQEQEGGTRIKKQEGGTMKQEFEEAITIIFSIVILFV